MKKRKLISGLLSAVALSLGLAVSASAATVGDIDGNGALSPRDALLVLKSAAGLEIDAKYVVNAETADISGDGIVDAKDAYLILTKSTGNEYYAPLEDYIEPFSGKVYIMADSIAANHNAGTSNYERPLYGWGVVFDEYFVNTFDCNNKAISSQSTYTYCHSQDYNYAMSKIAEDDYVFVSFGHNDHTPGELVVNGQKVDRMTPLGDENTEGTFQWYLKTKYIDPILEKGAVPIVMTAVCRATFDENGVFTEDPEHLEYGKAVVDLVKKYQEEGKPVYLIDTQTHTYNLYTELTKEEGGKEEVMSYHGLIGDPTSEWNFDSTHYCEKGARMLAEFIIDSLIDMDMDIVRYLKGDWQSVSAE